MKKRQLIGLAGCLVLAVVQSGFAATYGRNAGGSWHETNSTWKISGSFVSTLPGSGDTVSLTAADETIDLSGAAVNVFAVVLGAWEATLTKLVTLNVQSDLTTGNAINIGSAASNTGNGAMVVSNATVTTGGSTLIGKTADGSLTLDGGAVFQNTAWRVDLGSNATVTINSGTLSMVNGLLMVDGARVDINGSSELWLMGNDQTQGSDPLMQYISNGWIYGNGLAGNVEATYDGTKTIVRAISLGYRSFTDLYGMTGEPNSDPNDDYDGDGQLNVYEYGLGGDPTNSFDIGTEPTFAYGADTNVVFSHVVLTDPSADITYIVEQNPDLVSGTWTNSGWNLISTNATGDADFDEVQYRTSSADKDKLFIRLRITRP